MASHNILRNILIRTMQCMQTPSLRLTPIALGRSPTNSSLTHARLADHPKFRGGNLMSLFQSMVKSGRPSFPGAAGEARGMSLLEPSERN